MALWRYALSVFLTSATIICFPGWSIANNTRYTLNLTDSLPIIKPKNISAVNCYDINWATWGTFNDVNTTTGSVLDADGSPISITMSANYSFGSTPSIYTYSRFSSYPSNIPNSTVPKTTWAAGAGGTTTMCFSKTVTNPVLLLSSLGSSLPTSSKLQFSTPYVVLFDGGGMVYNDSKNITGTEGYAIIMFPGDFTCVTINSSTPENYTNLTWGIRPQPFNIAITDLPSSCGSAVVTANGGIKYKWDGGDTPDQATNTFHQSGTYLLTVTNASGCVTSVSKTINVNTAATPTITSFSFPQQNYAAVINQAAHTINVEVSSKADIKRLIPAITISNGTISPASASEQDFTNDVIYHLTSTCGVADYRVTVKVAVSNVMKICQTEQNILIPGSLISGATYQWQRYSNGTWQSTGLSGTNSSYIAPVSTGSAEIVDSYRRQVTVNNIISYDNYTDVYNEPSILNNLVTADKQTICVIGDKTLNITGNIPSGNSVIYQWQSSTDNNAWATITGATQKDLQINFTSTVSLYYRRLANNSTCNAISNVVKVDYSGPVTVANAGSSRSGCDQVLITLNANIPASSEIGTWTVVSPSSYSPFNSTSVHDPNAILNNFPQDIDVLLKWTITKTDCNQQSESTINLHSVSSPTVNAGTDKYIEPGESVTLHAEISSSNSYSYQWSPATGLNNPSLKDPVAKPTETTTYTLTALADNGNCEKTDMVTVFVNNTLEVPNTFTPNGDGYNDIWNIKNIISYKKVSVTILNRWGNQIYYSNGYAKPWDGTFNGKKVTPGTYYYIIDVTDTHIKKSGSITVIY
ncbi:T9SS type B sorting domain-containing protein [Mucilaginibacter pallidiroseus]|uniref:T9SS type B sorting domain-containing protein n=1 Tax=Mucilaginibacter pallidiroseus TaxID=2599295 RepID=A0A563UG67_9SPHI|nr:gliding motility-associated C-terminal domain-containing protein [Mucilaginibacter pallidiroseus]TWR30348.1 T9SS type B sorting domain-containing protein [Mucilaginibacter pallidiroseus]